MDKKAKKKDTALREHIKARLTRKPNRVIKRSFIEAAMCNHNIVILLMGMLVLLGILGLATMPKQEMPQFTVRQGACVAVYPGATSAEVEERVAKPLENFIFGYKEVNKKKTYTQSKDGMLIAFMELNDYVEDKDAFWSKFKHGLQAFKSSLPSGVIALQAVDDIAETSALLITIESKQKTYRELNTYIDNLKDRPRRIQPPDIRFAARTHHHSPAPEQAVEIWHRTLQDTQRTGASGIHHYKRKSGHGQSNSAYPYHRLLQQRA